MAAIAQNLFCGFTNFPDDDAQLAILSHLLPLSQLTITLSRLKTI
jgi:hypothetical protein